MVEDLSDGAVVVERTFASHEWLAREVLKEAGDAVVLEPEEARAAVLEAAEALAGAVQRLGPGAGCGRALRRARYRVFLSSISPCASPGERVGSLAQEVAIVTTHLG